MGFFNKWILHKVIGKFIIILNSEYIKLTKSDKYHSDLLKQRDSEIQQLKHDITIYRQLLDQSEQANRNYGNKLY